MKETIITVLGSSAFSAIITLLFNWVQNRKSNLLNYITEERKLWREKIRSIIIDIEKSKYKGEEEKNINQYLVQLEMNINPYGKNRQFDYAQDGHIWRVIEEIREAGTEEAFIKNKKILLEYLHIMLKEDWERSKKEVSGYSYIFVQLIILVVTSSIYLLFCFFILKINNYWVWITIIMFSFMPVIISRQILSKIYLLDEKYNIITVKNIIMKKREGLRVVIFFVAISLGFMWGNSYIVRRVYPEYIVDKMECGVENDRVYVYTELNLNIWSKLQTDIKESIGTDVNIVNEKKNSLHITDEYDEMLLAVVKKSMYLWDTILMIIMSSYYTVTVLYLIWVNINVKKGMYKVEGLKKIAFVDCINDYNQIVKLIEKIDMDREKVGKNNSGYFDLIYKLLYGIETVLQIKNSELENKMRSIDMYEQLEKQKENMEYVKNAIKDIEKIFKKKKRKKQMVLFKEIKSNIEKINFEFK